MKTKTLQSFVVKVSLLLLFFIYFQVNLSAQAEANHGPNTCFPNWKIKLFERPYYQGDFLCFRKGEYFVDRDCHDRHYNRFSFKLKQGYVVWFYDNRGRLIRRMDRSERHARFSFHKFIVKRAGQPEDPHVPGYVDCYPDWKLKLFDMPNLSGDFECFRKGEYYAGSDCDDFDGRHISFKLRSGYQVSFYDHRDRLIRRFTSSSNYFRGGFTRFVIARLGGRHDDDDDLACGDDWRVKIFERPQYRGDYRCFRKGNYRNGEDCDDYHHRTISFKIKHGWQLWIYNQHGHCIRKYTENVPHYRGDIHRFEVKRLHGPGGYGG